MIRILVIAISVLLFYLEPIFGLFSPIELNGDFYVFSSTFSNYIFDFCCHLL